MSKTWKEQRPRTERVYRTREQAIDRIREVKADQDIQEALTVSEEPCIEANTGRS